MKKNKLIGSLLAGLLVISHLAFAQTTHSACSHSSVAPLSAVHIPYDPDDMVPGKTSATDGVRIYWVHEDTGDPFWIANRPGIENCEKRVEAIIAKALAAPTKTYHIRIKIIFNDISSGYVAGIPAKTKIKNVAGIGTGSISPDLHYPFSLANFIKAKYQSASERVYGSGTTSDSYDMEINVNTITTEFENKWHFNWVDPCPLNQYDYTTMLLHEVVHGLGYEGFIEQTSGSTAHFVGNHTTIYDNFLEDDKTGSTSPCLRKWVYDYMYTHTSIYKMCIGEGNYNGTCSISSNELFIRNRETGLRLDKIQTNTLGQIKPYHTHQAIPVPPAAPDNDDLMQPVFRMGHQLTLNNDHLNVLGYLGWEVIPPVSVDYIELRNNLCTGAPPQVLTLGTASNYCLYSTYSMNWSTGIWKLYLFSEDGDGIYEIATQSMGSSWNLTLSSLPSHTWKRNIDGRVMGLITYVGQDISGHMHENAISVGVNYTPQDFIVASKNISTPEHCDKYLIRYFAPGASSYNVFYRYNTGSWSSWIAAGTTTGIEKEFTGLDETIDYEFKVEAVNSYGTITSDVISRPACCLYDITHYPPITSAVTWTPTSNPVYAGIPTSTITVGSDLTIAAGGSLTLQGMTLKMASRSKINVAAASSGAGGRLVLDNSKLTINDAGCDASGSMWKGVRVYGNPYASQSAAPTVQGRVTMYNNSEISYADTAVLLGPVLPGIPDTWMGGGIIQARNSTFKNNNYGAIFKPYTNTNPSTGAVVNNISSFRECKFINDDPATIRTGAMMHIAGEFVKGIPIAGCEFVNSCGRAYTTYGIYGSTMGFTVARSGLFIPGKFTNLTYGVYQFNSLASYTTTIRNAVFTGNTVGIKLDGTIAPVVSDNSFSVPYLTGGLALYPPFSTPVPIQTIGLFLDGAYGYSVYGNSFQYGSSSGLAPWGVENKSVGILAWNTGNSDNLINNNSFKGLGTANLANYSNRYGANGLWYKCNTNVNNRYDIATRGANDGSGTPLDANDGDGIRIYQGLPSGSSGYPDGLAGGNTFSISHADYNLYNLTSECVPFTYYYASTAWGGVAVNEPGVPGTTGNNFDLSANRTIVSTGNKCGIPGGIYDPISGTTTSMSGGVGVIDILPNFTADDRHISILSNVNYYMNDSVGVTHRDSLYYWMGELQTPEAAMATAYMLLEDTLIDSAYTLYSSISSAYAMDGNDIDAYDNWGDNLFSVEIVKKIRAGAPTVLFADVAAIIDTMTDSTVNSLIEASVVDAFYSARGWSRVRAENILQGTNRALYESLLLEMPDTLLYPEPDSAAAAPTDKGVLIVTELSQGPVDGCQYAELLVSNCGKGTAPYVDVRGWRIDDYSGFLTDCDPQNANPGNFRLAYDETWEHMTIGSKIIIYNAGNNCYNMPDSFTVDTFSGVYYVPVGASGNNHLEQFIAAENSNACNYCSDSGTTVYDTADSWSHIYLDTVFDCIQVICPGCTPENPSSPKMYFGAGYYPIEYEPEWEQSALGGYTAGVVVVPNFDVSGRYKYVFVGETADELLTPGKWDVLLADIAGTIPTTIGNVEAGFFEKVINHEAGMPCCAVPEPPKEEEAGRSAAQGGESANSAVKNIVAGIKVYPNPASMLVHFEFPQASETTIKVTDVTGRVVHEQTVHETGKTSVNVKGFVPGVYMYQVVTKAGLFTGKLVIN